MDDGADRAWAGEPDAKRRRLTLLATIVLLGTGAAVAFHYVMAYYLGRGYPYSTFLFLPSDHFNDWNNTYRYAQHFLTGQSAPFVYFPFAFLCVAAATVLPMSLALALLTVAYLAGLSTMLWRCVLDVLPGVLQKLQYCFILVVMAYPVLFTIDRGNLEMAIFLTVGGMFYFVYGRRSDWGAGLCLAAAIAMKLYPATLVVLLLAERRFKAAIVAAAGALVLTAASTAALAGLSGRSMAAVWHQAYTEKGVYQRIQVNGGAGLQHSHTLWDLLRMPGLLLHAAPERPWQHSAYVLVVLVIFGLLAVHVLFRESESWRKAALMVIAALALPFVSGDYTTPLLFFPLVLFLNSARVSRYDVVYVVVFGLLLVPVDYHYFTSIGLDTSTSVIVYGLALVVLTLLTVRDSVRAPAAVALRAPGNAAMLSEETP